MLEYHIRFAVGKLDHSWFEAEVTVLNDDEGDARAIEMGESQLRNTYDRNNTPVAFITLLQFRVSEEDYDYGGEEEGYYSQEGLDWQAQVNHLISDHLKNSDAPTGNYYKEEDAIEAFNNGDAPDEFVDWLFRYDTNCKICGGGTKLAAIAGGEAEWHRCQETCKQLLPYMPRPPAYDPSISVLDEDEIRDKYANEEEDDE